MESTLRYTGTIEKSMELVSKNCAIDWAAIGPRENQSQVIALVFGKLRLGLLLALMIAYCLDNLWRHNKRAPATAGLWLDQHKLSIDSLELLCYAQISHLKIDVSPSQA